jgi:undecaprenyl-diphosphatase
MAAFISRVGSVGPMRWVGMLAAVFFFARGRGRATLSLAAAPWLALAVYAGTRRLLPRSRPPGAAGYHEMASSFPSAHATTSAAVCCTLAYILWREQMLNGRAALAIAIIPPLCIGLSRVYLDVHWMTDVLAGWLAGLLVAVVAGSVHRFLSARAE